MCQRTATASAFRNHHFGPVPREQADRTFVDRWVENFLCAAGHQSDSHFALTFCGEDLWFVPRRGWMNRFRGERDHRFQTAREDALKGPANFCAEQSEAEQHRVR